MRVFFSPITFLNCNDVEFIIKEKKKKKSARTNKIKRGFSIRAPFISCSLTFFFFENFLLQFGPWIYKIDVINSNIQWRLKF